jgi:hypothetical protein
VTEIDGAIAELRSSTNEIRAAQNAAEEAWREPLAELTAAGAKTRSDIVRLRASIDELNRPQQPEVIALSARIDRIEQAMIEHNLLLRGTIQPAARHHFRAPRASAAVADGHIINLTPTP